MAALYELAVQVRGLLELEGLDQQTINDTLDGLGFEDKVSGCVAVIKQMQAEADMLKTEAEKLAARSKAAQNKAENLKSYVLQNMQLAGVTKAGTTLHQAMIPKPRESVFITDASLLPPNLVSVEQKLLPDKAAILAAIHAGYKILGAEIQNKPSLRIK